MDLTQLQMYRNFTGFQFAVMAVRTFQLRHERAKRYRHATKTRNQQATISLYAERVGHCREYVRAARAKGWRGSVMKILTERR